MDYTALIRQKAVELGLDPDLAERMAATESSMNPNAVSSKGAQGLFQLMPGTARELGVDPTDPVQNIDGGLRYYKQMLDRFGGDQRLALAAYNAGPGNVQKYGGIPPFAETQNYVQKILPVQTAQANTGTMSDAPPAEAGSMPTIDQAVAALEKARAAKDSEAIAELEGYLKPKFQSALGAARQAKDDAAVGEIQAMSRSLGFSSVNPPKAKPTAEAPKEEMSTLGKVAKTVDDAVRGVADTVTFGYSDEIAAALDNLFGVNTSGKGGTPQNYSEALAAQRARDAEGGGARVVGQIGGAFIPGLGVLNAARAPAATTRLARAGRGALGGAVAGGLYGSGSAEGDLADRAGGAVAGATIGAVTGGVLGGVLPSTAAQEGTKILNKAGSNKAAAMDAEIIRDINKVAGGTNQRGVPVGAVQLNALENKYVGDVTTALKSLGKKNLEKLGLKSDDIANAVRDKRIIGPEDLAKLRTTKAGTALADAIEKAQRARSLTAAVPAATNPLARVGRAALDLAPIPQPLRYVGQRMLGSRQTREDVASKLVSDKMAGAAESVLARTGPSEATKSLARLQEQAQKATAAAQARAQAMAQAKAAQQASQAATRNQVLAQTRTPLGGSFQELLAGGRAGTNLNSRDAIAALRILRGQGGAVGDAAEQILKSRAVSDPNAFYGLQNQLRRLQEAGKIPGAPMASQAASSGVRNPISYAEAVRTAGEAANIARSAAPTKELGQFATKIAGIKNPADKAKAVSERLAKATDPAEADFINKFVVPLTQFGAKGK